MTFYSIPGMRPSGGEGKMNGRSRAAGVPQLPDINDPVHQEQLGEWIKSRDETSHQAVGLDPGQDIWFDHGGERRAAKVLHEERDQHTGAVEVTFAANDDKGSGTYRTKFKPDGARNLVQSETKRIHE